MHIVVPLDGSTRAEFAIGTAAQLAAHAIPRATITLLRVVDLIPAAQSDWSPEDGTTMDGAVAASGDYLHEISLRPSLASFQIHCVTRIATESVAATISAQAQELKADLIVMSSSGRGGGAPTALGSIALAVAQLASIPTVIVRVEVSFRAQHDIYQPFTVLAALDGSPRAEAVLPSVVTIARTMYGVVRLLHVLPTPGGTSTDDDQHQAAEDYLQAVQQRLQRQGVPTDIRLGRGDPAHCIVQEAQAKRRACDVVALATHGRTGMARQRMGSVAEDVLHAAQCPVVILRPTA